MLRIDTATYSTRDLGLLLLRIGVGTSMVLFHGWGKISGGPARWQEIGDTMPNFGLAFLHTFWGFMAGFAEFFASILLAVGFFFRPAAALLAITMLVAITHHLRIPAGEPGSGWRAASHALELFCVYVALFLSGPGRYALGLLGKRRDFLG